MIAVRSHRDARARAHFSLRADRTGIPRPAPESGCGNRLLRSVPDWSVPGAVCSASSRSPDIQILRSSLCCIRRTVRAARLSVHCLRCGPKSWSCRNRRTHRPASCFRTPCPILRGWWNCGSPCLPACPPSSFRTSARCRSLPVPQQSGKPVRLYRRCRPNAARESPFPPSLSGRRRSAGTRSGDGSSYCAGPEPCFWLKRWMQWRSTLLWSGMASW